MSCLHLIKDGSQVNLSGGADFIFIPERPPLHDPWEDQMCEAVERVRVGCAPCKIPLKTL